MGKRVLVVDDDPDVRLFTTTVLEENGYVPLEAENGEDGLRMIRSEQPDLVILDVLMPRQSGIRLYRELKSHARAQERQGADRVRHHPKSVSALAAGAGGVRRGRGAGARVLP